MAQWHDLEWLQRHLPQPDRALGLEMHTRTRAGYPLPVSNTLGLYKVEQHAWPATAARCDYVLCNATMSGRGILNPFTGKRYDVYEANRRAFLAGSERLRSWSPAFHSPVAKAPVESPSTRRVLNTVFDSGRGRGRPTR